MTDEKETDNIEQPDLPGKVAAGTDNPPAQGRRGQGAGGRPGNRLFPIVALCTSAGGVEALQQFFTHMPADSGLAFVVAIHLSPHYESTLPELLQQHTHMPVVQIRDGVEVQPDHVYVIPPNRDIGVLHGTLQLMERIARSGWPMTIDSFLSSLAADQGERAIGIILSGAGTDGTLGIRAIKEKGGLTVVQTPETAAQEGMPRSAISTGLVDYVLPIPDMPPKLVAYASRAIFKRAAGRIETPPLPADGLNKIFMLLRAQTGHDFTYYKHTTINRRIRRRMLVNQIDSLAGYVNFMRRQPDEVGRLFKELLIGVTNFFRDPEAFEALTREVLPELFSGRALDEPLRVWVPGCATGEEAYTLAILLREFKEATKAGVEIQIFATDVDAEAVNFARRGIYPASIAQHLSPQRLDRFFTRVDHSYEIRKEIREMVVIAEQNLIKDPPFSHLDLISCRNVLIYLSAELQKSVLALFHYALKPAGCLFLGPSESVGDLAGAFTVVDRQWRLFRKTGEEMVRWPGVDFFVPLPPEKKPALQSSPRELDNRELAQRLLLEHYGAACAIINQHYHVFYTYGPADRYLKLPRGEMSSSILDMAREGLELDLMAAIHHAIMHEETAVHESVWVQTNGGKQRVNLIVKPVDEPPARAGLLMVIFEQGAAPAAAGAVEEEAPAGEETNPRIVALERELQSTKQHLQTALEEMQTAYEELKSTNEEMQSANEELQSSNEELKTSKEELQSVNEELTTVNLDFQTKNEELTKANNDLHNLLRATHIATLFLDNDLCIKGFTPAVAQIINLIPVDIGRPLHHIVANLRYDNLVADAEHVLDTLATQEKEVQAKDGRWYQMRIMPYRTVENVIDGLVIVFRNITEQRRAAAELRRARDLAQNIVDTAHEALLVLDTNLCLVSANRSFYDRFQLQPAESKGHAIDELGNGQWDIPELRRLLEEIVAHDNSVDGHVVEHDFPNVGRRVLRLNARRVSLAEEGDTPLILLAIDDITNNQQARANS